MISPVSRLDWRLPLGNLLLIISLSHPLAASEDQGSIVARVDGVAITTADVDREIERAYAGRTVDAQATSALRQHAVEQLIRRQLVLRYLRDTQLSAQPAEIDLAIERLKMQLAQREEPWDAYLKARKLDEKLLRGALAWQIGWDRLLQKYSSDSSLKQYFDKHRRDFDGTQVRVAHILFPVAAGAAARTAAHRSATDLLAKIRGGELTFADAARRFSSSPSRDAGGDIGLISRHEPMPEGFSRQAFSLEVNQVSDPVETSFGVHLIQCLEIVPGEKAWTEVRFDLERAISEYLFNWAADQVRAKSKIEIPPGGNRD